MVSLRNAWLPRPSAKNEYRQLSCSISAGRVRPRARNACPAVPLITAPAASTKTPMIRPTIVAVPVHLATARRQTRTRVPLNLTISGSETGRAMR